MMTIPRPPRKHSCLPPSHLHPRSLAGVGASPVRLVWEGGWLVALSVRVNKCW